MKVKVKKLSDKAVVPKYAKEGDAGLDLTATSRKQDSLGFMEYGTDLAIEIPYGHVGLIFPRSSISKINMSLTNSVGVIDAGFRGEIRFRFKPSTAGKNMYEVGDRVGQLVIIPYPQIELEEADELSETVRGTGGFGSSNLTKLPKISINENGLVEGLE